MLMFKYMNKSILPIAAGVTMGLTIIGIGGIVSSIVGSVISGSFMAMSGYIIGDAIAVIVSTSAIGGLCYLAYKQDHYNENISITDDVDNIKVSEIVDSHVNDEIKTCEVIISGETFENVDFS